MQQPRPTDIRALIKRAVERFGISHLDRRLNWKKGAIGDAIAGRRPVGPYRAAQIAEDLGEDPVKAALSALLDQARDEEEQAFWTQLITGKKTHLSEPELREAVHKTIGPKYVSVVASGITRYLREQAKREEATEEHIAELAYRAREFFDAWPNVFESGKSKIAIGDRRQLMADFLSGDERSAVVTAQRWNALNQS